MWTNAVLIRPGFPYFMKIWDKWKGSGSKITEKTQSETKGKGLKMGMRKKFGVGCRLFLRCALIVYLFCALDSLCIPVLFWSVALSQWMACFVWFINISCSSFRDPFPVLTFRLFSVREIPSTEWFWQNCYGKQANALNENFRLFSRHRQTCHFERRLTLVYVARRLLSCIFTQLLFILTPGIFR